jgi:hypothetical protein
MTNKLGYALAIGFVYTLLAIFSGDTAVLSDLPNPALLALGTVLPAALFVGSALAFHSTKA